MFKIKEEQGERIKRKYKLTYIAEEIGVSITLLSFILKGKRPCSKKLAYCITKFIDSEAEISEFFVRTDEEE